MYKHSTLKNGLQLYIVPMKSTATATVLVLVRAGSKYEVKRINGMSHFLEHMFFKGTTKRPSPMAVVETLDRVGGEYNAFTDKEHTGYYAKVDTRHLELAVDWVSDMLLNPLMDATEIEREKGVVAQEMSMYQDTPTSYMSDVFESLLYGNQPAGWEVLGSKEIISKFKREDFLNYLDERYVANETFIVIAGNVQEKKVKKLVSTYFGSFKSGRAPRKLKAKESQKSPGLKIHHKKTDQTHIQIGVRGLHAYDKRRYALSMLATILGGGMSSRMFMSVREKHGLAYYVSTRSDNYTDTGYLSTRAGVPNKDLIKAVSLILSEYKKIRDIKVGGDELKKAKDYIKGKVLIGLESSDAQASFVADQAILHGKAEPADVLLKKFDAVTAADIQRVAKTIFRNDRLNLAVIGPKGQEAALKKVLKFT